MGNNDDMNALIRAARPKPAQPPPTPTAPPPSDAADAAAGTGYGDTRPPKKDINAMIRESAADAIKHRR